MSRKLIDTDEWQDMDTAPRDGTPIQAEIPGNGCTNVIAWVGGLYSEEGEHWSWTCIEDDGWPDGWDDGVCWSANADGKPSVQPTRWRALE